MTVEFGFGAGPHQGDGGSDRARPTEGAALTYFAQGNMETAADRFEEVLEKRRQSNSRNPAQRLEMEIFLAEARCVQARMDDTRAALDAMEESLRRGLIQAGGNITAFLQRPICAVFIFLTVFVLITFGATIPLDFRCYNDPAGNIVE